MRAKNRTQETTGELLADLFDDAGGADPLHLCYLLRCVDVRLVAHSGATQTSRSLEFITQYLFD